MGRLLQPNRAVFLALAICAAFFASCDTMEWPTFTVTFDTNGGHGGTPAPQTVDVRSTITLPNGNLFARSGFAFGGWNSSADGTGTNHGAGTQFTPNRNLTLFARWVPVEVIGPVIFTVTFDANGGSGNPPTPQTVMAGSAIMLPGAGGLSRPGFTFGGWNTGMGVNYSAGTMFTPTGNITLFARWVPVGIIGPTIFTVTFDANGGSGIPPTPQTVMAGSAIMLPGAGGLSRPGFTFVGWNTSPNAMGAALFPGTVFSMWNENITLHAIWSEFQFDHDSGTITGFTGTDMDIVIPFAINTLPVTSIGPYAFANNWLTEVIIPDSVIYIGAQAFAVNLLTEIVIPDSVTYIGGGAFDLNLLIEVIIPNNVTYIGPYAFARNRLTEIVIPDSVTYIGGGAFDFNHLTEVVIPDSVTSIGEGAFASNLLTEVVIPYSVTSIESWTFAMNQLTEIVIPYSVTSIRARAFEFNQLTEVVIPDSVTYIGVRAFWDNALTSITIPANVDIAPPPYWDLSRHTMGTHGDSFLEFYNNTGRRAGTYTFDGIDWHHNY